MSYRHVSQLEEAETACTSLFCGFFGQIFGMPPVRHQFLICNIFMEELKIGPTDTQLHHRKPKYQVLTEKRIWIWCAHRNGHRFIAAASFSARWPDSCFLLSCEVELQRSINIYWAFLPPESYKMILDTLNHGHLVPRVSGDFYYLTRA